MSQLRKIVAITEMRHSVTVHSQKKVPQPEICVTVRKDVLQLEKWVPVKKCATVISLCHS